MKLGAFELVMSSLVFIGRNFVQLLKISVVPVVIMLTFIIGFGAFFASADNLHGFGSNFFLFFVLTILYFSPIGLCLAVVICAWHRVILQGADSGRIGVGFYFAIPELIYVFRVILLGLLTAALAWVAVFLIVWFEPTMIRSTLIRLLPTALFAYIWARFCLAFPAAAVDKAYFGLGSSWEATKGNVLSIWIAFLSVMLFFYLVDLALTKLLLANFQLQQNSFAVFLYNLLDYIFIFASFIINATIMSFAYQTLVESAEPGAID